jgi:copper homeostasis protein
MAKANSSLSYSLEICVDSVASAVAAEQGGAQRVELCDYLSGGGTTPSAGMISLVRENISLPLHVLIRPRRGDFLYSRVELDIMLRDIKICQDLGADGIVLGLLTKEGDIDVAKTEELMHAAGDLSITFHRAFDLTRDPLKAFDQLVNLGIDRLLTSGQQQTAVMGIPLIKKLQEKAAGKISIMPGGGVNPGNLREIATNTGVREVHASVRKSVASDMLFRKEYPPMSSHSSLSEFEQLVADVSMINEMRQALNHLSADF